MYVTVVTAGVVIAGDLAYSSQFSSFAYWICVLKGLGEKIGGCFLRSKTLSCSFSLTLNDGLQEKGLTLRSGKWCLIF